MTDNLYPEPPTWPLIGYPSRVIVTYDHISVRAAQYPTHAAAQAAIEAKQIMEGDIVYVVSDETMGGLPTTWKVESGTLANPFVDTKAGVVAIDSIADLLALPDAARRADLRYLVKGYHAGTDIGGGEFYWDANSTVTANGGTIFGTGTGRFIRRYDGEDVSAFWFGCKGDGTTDDTANLIASINFCKTLVLASYVLPGGNFYTTDTIEFDLPNYSTIRFVGRIVSNVSGKTAVRLGSRDANRLGYTAYGIDVRRTANDLTSGSVGLEVSNIFASEVHHRYTTGFTDGVLINGTQPNGGVSYCKVFLGYVLDNKHNVRLTASGAGYCNENTIYGGRYGYSSAYPEPEDTFNLRVEHFSGNRLNNNRFIAPSFEAHSNLTTAAFIDGRYCLIIHPRMENSGDYQYFKIHFGENSEGCELIGKGFGVLGNSIQDDGFNNCYETKHGITLNSETPAGTNTALLTLRGTASGSAALLQGRGVAGTRTFALYANGVAEFVRGYFGVGIRWSTSDGSTNDRGLFVGSGSPEGAVTASVGSLYKETGTANVWTKIQGTGNTGWVQLQINRVGMTGSRPTSQAVGNRYFDTTLGKPIWWNGTAWVDATGGTV